MSPRILAFCAALLLGDRPGAAQETPSTPSPETKPTPQPEQARREETLVVTPCRGCSTSVVNSPAAVTVISRADIASAPDRSFGEMLKNVPGINSIKMSVRDFNISTRTATSTLSDSELVLVDGRSNYLDVIGIILWDLIPVNPDDIEQIEVVRGPASAAWGAYAFTGVVNIITRAPRTAEGSSFRLTLGELGRDEGSRANDGPGLAYGVEATLSRAISDRVAFRVAGGYS